MAYEVAEAGGRYRDRPEQLRRNRVVIDHNLLTPVVFGES